MSYEPYYREFSSPEDRVAWALCQIIDDDAPLRWTRYRFVAACIAGSDEVMSDLDALRTQIIEERAQALVKSCK